MHRRFFATALMGFALMTSCQADKEIETTKKADESSQEKPDDSKRVRLKTNHGDIVIQMNERKAPISVTNFLKYVESGHYDGTVFHRVIESFMIQGGGFSLEDGSLVEKKTGKPIKNESMNGLRNDRGTIAMARTNDPNSATAQFFINVVDNQALNYPNNNGYAVFGKVVEGMDVVDKIRKVATGMREMKSRNPNTGGLMASPSPDVPLENVVIESAKVE